jgi:hypothetical protein
MKDLKYYKDNCEEDYLHTPISVLRYITELEKEVESKPLIIDSVVGSAKQLEGFGEDLTRVFYVKCSECGCEHNDNGNEYCCGCGRKFE